MSTITEDYVSFEIAKLLKERGFDRRCRAYYASAGSFSYEKYEVESSECEIHNAILAPTLQMAMKWLREKHLLHISINMANGGRWEYEIDDINNPFDGGVLPKHYCSKSFCSYEEGINDAIKYCLENLI